MRVLVVDDESRFAHWCAATWSERFEPITVADGPSAVEAVEAVRRALHDVVVAIAPVSGRTARIEPGAPLASRRTFRATIARLGVVSALFGTDPPGPRSR